MQLLYTTPANLQDLIAERIVLGTCMSSRANLELVMDSVTEKDFFEQKNAALFLLLKKMYTQEHVVGLDTFINYVNQLGSLEQVGGLTNIIDCQNAAGTSSCVKYYIEIIKNLSKCRRLRKIFFDGYKSLETPEELDDKSSGAYKRIYEEMCNEEKRDLYSLAELADGALHPQGLNFREQAEYKQEMYAKYGSDYIGENSVLSGFKDFDRFYRGFKFTSLNIIAARPAMGKTAFALNIATKALEKGVTVGLFSLEMSSEEIGDRIISSVSEVPLSNLFSGDLVSHDIHHIEAAQRNFKRSKGQLYICDRANSSLDQIKIKSRHLANNLGCKLIIIDYLQLISCAGSQESRQVEVSAISRGLKLLAKELDVAIICLSQLSRKCEERSDKKPMLSDLRESGSIEQDADKVIFLMRRDYYDPLDKPGMAQVIVAKNRSGPTGYCDLVFNRETVLFKDFAPDEPGKDFHKPYTA